MYEALSSIPSEAKGGVGSTAFQMFRTLSVSNSRVDRAMVQIPVPGIKQSFSYTDSSATVSTEKVKVTSKYNSFSI